MPKRRENVSSTKDIHHIDLDALPIAIQNFLWRQLSPFVRPYNRKLQEASCVTLERVVVQNIRHGLSPSLSDAIESIPRWRFITATLPYVMHCCASTLDIKSRRSIQESPSADHLPPLPLGPNSTKLLYTLHWILLDAAAECGPDQGGTGDRGKGGGRYSAQSGSANNPSLDPLIFPVTTLQVFVYLFAPLLPHLRPSDFTSFRLENGLKIWQPLWEYRQPDIPCFNAPAKPTPSTTDGQIELDQQQNVSVNVGDIYIGVQQDEGFLLAEPERNAEEAAAAMEALARARSAPHSAPIAHMSEICTLTTLDTPVTLTPNLEYFCEFCNSKILPDAKDVLRCKCGHHRRGPTGLGGGRFSAPPASAAFLSSSATSALAQQASLAASFFVTPSLTDQQQQQQQNQASRSQQYSPVDKEFLHNKLEQSIQPDGRAQSLRDVSAATLFDVAVLRCLHVPPWSEEGLFWAVRYFLNRLIEIRDYLQRTVGLRQRSNSVPSVKQQQQSGERAGGASTSTVGKWSASSSPNKPLINLTPLSHRENLLLSPLERSGSKRRRIASSSLDEAATSYKPKFFLGGEKLSAISGSSFGRNEDTSPANSPGANRPQDVIFSFGDEERLLASPTSTRAAGLFSSSTTSNPVTPRERGMMRRSGQSFPRITITTENSPLAGDEDMEGIGLTRSKTDSSIAYPLSEYQEARGASNLINEDGQLNYQALVRAILVALNERPSQRICDVALSLLDVLLDLILDVKPVLPNDSPPGPIPPPPAPQSPMATNYTPPPPPSMAMTATIDGAVYRLFLSCITRILIVVGCPYGCGKESPPSRGNPTEYLRRQAYLFFHRLQTLNEPEARKFYKNMFTSQELALVVEFCHAFFGSCVSPAAQDHSRTSKQLKKTMSWVAAQATKPIITRLMDQLEYIKRPENLGLQNDLRSFLTFIKEAYDHVFRRVVMSGVMESQQRLPSSAAGGGLMAKSRPDTPTNLHLQMQQNPTSNIKRRNIIRNSRLESAGDQELELLPSAGDQSDGDNLSSFEDSNNTPSAGYLRGLFAKKPKSHLKQLRDRESSETNLKMTAFKSPRVSLSEDESNMPTGSPANRKKKHGLGIRQRWLKSPKSSLGSRDSRRGTLETSMSLTGSGEGSSEQSRQQSVESGQPGGAAGKAKLSFNATGHISLGVIRTKRLAENFVREREEEVAGLLRRSGTNKSEDAPLSTCTSFLLNIKALTGGMRCLGTLLEFCPPGTLPEPSVLSAMLDLQAPILSRAAFFFECAQFVHRCNQGRWPDWMKLTSSQYRQSGPISRLITAAPRKQNILQRTAGKVFYEWARSLTLRLEDVLRAEHVDPASVVSPTFVAEEEDYFLVGGDNLEPGNCPFALKLAACQLLLEITAFLRETYRALPRREKYGTMRTNQGRGTAGDKRLASRRWSSVASTSGGASHQSIQSFVENGQIHMFAGGHGAGERRISFMIADDNQSQKSASSAAEDEERRSHLLKSGRDRAKHHQQNDGSQARRYSIRMRKSSHDESRRRADSIRSRKASSVSGRSDFSQTSSMEDGMSPHGEDNSRDRDVFGVDQETTEYSDNMPWLESLITLCSRFSFICDHKKACTLYCFYRIMRSSGRLTWSMRKIHGDHGQAHKSIAPEEDEILEVTQGGPSGTQTPTTPSSHRKMKIFRKASHYAGINRLSKTASLMEKNESIETVNKAGIAEGVPTKSEEESTNPYYPQTGEKSSVMAKYIHQQLISLFAAPFAAMAKGLLIMDEKQLERLFPVCWELLLVDDEEVTSLTASMCVVCAVKISKFVVDFIRKEMNHEESEERVDSVLKFQALWRYRYQVWIRLEDGAQGLMRVSQALNIDYTLPSPLIGRPTVDCPDSPWLPPTQIKVEEVAISQEEQSKNSNTLVAATQTRRKQLQESMSRALRAQEERIQRERERALITMMPVLRMASIEPVPPQVIEEREEGDDGGPNAETSTVATHTLTVQPVFPGSLALAALLLIDLLDDADVDSCGICVSDLAFHTLWEGIVEDASLFLRHILEKVSNKERQNFILRKLRRLMGHMPRLPPQAAATLFNHLMGYCMSYVRSPNENNLNGVESVMSVLWHIVPSVEGISFRDIKVALRREQCDAHLLLTANVPGAKKVVIHGPDLTSIPSQLPVQEETQFDELLTESLDFFGIPENGREGFILVDSKTGRAHHPSGFVRDVYFFRRSYYPQLNLVRLPEKEAFTKLQFQACHNLFLEAQKVFLVSSLFQNALLKSDSALQQQQAMLLEDGLTKMPNFPRKALECDVKFEEGPFGQEYLGIDVMHKYSWIQMTASLLTTLSKSTAEVQLSHQDILMLLSVLNGVLVLHCQDSAILRLSLSTFVTVARNMKSLFATTGFLSIMPTILEIYATHQSNKILTEAIEFTCSQLFILHRNPFLLQLFGSAAALLELSAHEPDNAKPLKRSHIKKILFSLEKYGRRPSKPFVPPIRSENNQAYHPLDYLDVLELVESRKALQPLDLCYQNDMYDFTPSSILTSAVSSCIAVIAFDTAESPRGTQMLQVLRTLIHEDVWYDEKPADNAKSAKEELQKIIALAGSLKSLIFSCESLTRPFTLPQRTTNTASEVTRHLGSLAPSFVPAHSKDIDVEANRPRIVIQETLVDPDSQWEFSSPRNHLLAIIAHFLATATSRIYHLSKFLGDLSTRPPEIIDAKSHVRLSDIAQTLLKVAPYDQEVMACEGLQLYMTEILPTVDFSVESLKQTLQQLLRRVDKTFIKIMKKPNSKRDTNWTAMAKIIQGLTKTLCHNNLIALMPQLRSITGNCISMTLAEPAASTGSDTALSVIPHALLLHTPMTFHPVASVFRQATIDLCAVYLQAGKEYCNLEQLSAQFSDQLFRLVVCILLPLVLRLGSGGTSDLPALRIEDLRYIIRALIQLLHPPVSKHQLQQQQQQQQHSTTGQSMKLTVTSNMTRTNSNMSNPPSGADRSSTSPIVTVVNKQQDLSRRVAFLGLKIVIVCYEGRLGSEWLRLAKSIEDYGEKGNVGLPFWHFLEYIIVNRTALYVHLVPFAAHILEEETSTKKETFLSEQEEQVQASIRRALSGHDSVSQKSAEAVFSQISQEITSVLDEYILLSSTNQPSRSPTQIVAEEGSVGEQSEGILRLADLARFRAHGKRKDSTQPTSALRPDRSSSSGGGGGGIMGSGHGKRSPPIVIPVVVERTEGAEAAGKVAISASSSSDQVGLDRKRSTLMRQRAQYGLGEGQNQHHSSHPPVKKRITSEIPEAMEMMQILKPTREEHLVNNNNNLPKANINSNNSKIITVSVLNSRKQSKDKLMPNPHRRPSLDSLNDDEKIMLLK